MNHAQCRHCFSGQLLPSINTLLLGYVTCNHLLQTQHTYSRTKNIWYHKNSLLISTITILSFPLPISFSYHTMVCPPVFPMPPCIASHMSTKSLWDKRSCMCINIYALFVWPGGQKGQISFKFILQFFFRCLYPFIRFLASDYKPNQTQEG